METVGSNCVARLRGEVAVALKSGDRRRAEILRLLLAAVKQSEIDSGATTDEPGLVAIVGRMIKQRRESIRQYDEAGREDLAAREREEIDLLETYLPAQMDAEAIADAVRKAVAETGATSAKEMGMVMARLKKDLAGRADFSVVSRLVREALG